MTSPSVMPSAAIWLRGKIGIPRALSSGRLLATCNLRPLDSSSATLHFLQAMKREHRNAISVPREGQKKWRTTRARRESFRRGCLKGTPYVQCGELLCKCEKYVRELRGLQSWRSRTIVCAQAH